MSSTLPTDYWARVVYLVTHYSASFLRGAGSTLLIALVGTFVGCLIGFAVGIVQTIPVSKQDSIIKRALLFIVKLILNIYVEVFRGTPMIVQAMFIYFGAMQYLGITMGMWFAAFFIVSINTGAYMAETVRGGILSIDPGQTEGAKAIALSDDAVRHFPADAAKHHSADRQQPDHQHQRLLGTVRNRCYRAVLCGKTDSRSLLLVV